MVKLIAYNSIYYIYIIYIVIENVNNSKISNKSAIEYLFNSNKYLIFAVDKSTLVLLTIK